MVDEVKNKTGLSTKNAIVAAVVLLLVGLAVTYTVVKTRAPKVVAPVATTTTPAGAVAPEQLKQLADQEAKPILEKLKSDPKDAKALAQLGDLRFDAGQYKESITYYEQSLALEPQNTRVRADMANAFAYSGDPDRAIAEYNTALKYDPKHGLSLMNLGLVQWHDKGDAKSAVETWKRLVKVNPEFARQVKVEELIAQAQKHAAMPMQKQAK